jgi:hypothetical protein
VGDIGRFPSPRELVSYLGLDPRVRQSGEERVPYGHISKEGASEARHMLCEAAWIGDSRPRAALQQRPSGRSRSPRIDPSTITSPAHGPWTQISPGARGTTALHNHSPPAT